MGGVTKALLAGSFVFGIAFGSWLTGEANFQPNNVASTEIVDRKTPSGAVCMANGYSSMVSRRPPAGASLRLSRLLSRLGCAIDFSLSLSLSLSLARALF